MLLGDKRGWIGLFSLPDLENQHHDVLLPRPTHGFGALSHDLLCFPTHLHVVEEPGLVKQAVSPDAVSIAFMSHDLGFYSPQMKNGEQPRVLLALHCPLEIEVRKSSMN
jgi:hypothetical protein